MAKFKDLKVGDSVRLSKLDHRKALYVSDMEDFLGRVAKIVRLDPRDKTVYIDFGEVFWYNAKWLTVVPGMKEISPQEMIESDEFLNGLELAQFMCHTLAKEAGWWVDTDTGESILNNPLTFSNKLMLIVSECAEAMEGDRKGLMDDKLPHRKMAEVELADVVIRAFDTAGGFGFDLAGAIVEKLKYNQSRSDHKLDSRRAAGGKSY